MKTTGTQYTGVRYREHATRRHNGQPDRYYTIRYKLDGKLKEEGLGWASEGMTAQRASTERGKLREAHRIGEGPATMAEKREIEASKRAEVERSAMTVSELIEKYIEHQRHSIKSWQWTKRWLELHAKPLIGSMNLTRVQHSHIENLRYKCQESGLSAASVVHVLQAIRGAFNFGIRNGLFVGTNPTKNIKFPKVDNARVRFLSREESQVYLDAVKLRSQTWHDMSLVSLYSGLRFGEIAVLRWKDIDIESGVIAVLDAKAGSRQAYIHQKMREMFVERAKAAKVANPADLVFPGVDGKLISKPGNSVRRTIIALGWNKGIEDSRQKVTFHTLRHTFASWLAMNGTPLLTIKELMGHRTITMTMRYAHLIPDQKRQAVEKL